MLAVHQQKRLCRRFVDVSAARRGCPHDEPRSVDRHGILTTDVRRSEMHSGVCSRSDLWTNKHSFVLDSLSDWQPVQLSKSWSQTITRLEIQNVACRCVQDSLERWQSGSCKTGQHYRTIGLRQPSSCATSVPLIVVFQYSGYTVVTYFSLRKASLSCFRHLRSPTK